MTLPPAYTVRPLVQELEEHIVANGVTEDMKSHRPADIDGKVEQVVGSGIADGEGPERIAAWQDREPEPENLIRRAQALALAPQPLRIGGKALIEPDVLPGRDCQRVSVPLVGELVSGVIAAIARERKVGIARSWSAGAEGSGYCSRRREARQQG